MGSSYPSRLRVWSHPAQAVADLAGRAEDLPLPVAGPARAWIRGPDQAERLFVAEALHALPKRVRLAESAPPYSLQWFLNIENHRHGRHGRWLPRLLEFAKHRGETLLGLGHGLGTDWLQYARHGARVLACSPSSSELDLVRRNFELRGLAARFLHAAPASLPLESASIDVVCVSEILQWVDDPAGVVEEVYRVLKPGGKVLAVVPSRYDVDFWCKRWFFWQRRLGRSRLDEVQPRWSARRLRQLFRSFVEHRIHKRQLRRSEVPHLWRVLPLPLLERVLGRSLVLKAFKPLCAALATQAAA